MDSVPSPIVGNFNPTIARAQEKIRLEGSSLRFTKSVQIGGVNAGFLIESDTSLLITVPDTAPQTLSSIGVAAKNNLLDPVLSSTRFQRTAAYYNIIDQATILTGTTLPFKAGDTDPIFTSNAGFSAWYIWFLAKTTS